MIIDAHTHLWKKQNGFVDGRPVFALDNGKSNFGGEIRQMMPPFMLSGENTAEMLISNMDYAGVNGAVITQEEIDGNQDSYLLSAKEKYRKGLKYAAFMRSINCFIRQALTALKSAPAECRRKI